MKRAAKTVSVDPNSWGEAVLIIDGETETAAIGLNCGEKREESTKQIFLRGSGKSGSDAKQNTPLCLDTKTPHITLCL